MPRYALVRPDNTVDRVSSDVSPDVSTRSGWRWLQCEPAAPPSYDQSSEKISGPTYSVGASAVTETWTKTLLSAQEISDAKDAAVGGLNGTAFAALAKVLLNHENRIRVLEGKGTITMAQFKAGIKALL